MGAYGAEDGAGSPVRKCALTETHCPAAVRTKNGLLAAAVKVVDEAACEAAAAAAVQLYGELWATFQQDEKVSEWRGACASAECRISERREELVGLVVQLLPWAADCSETFSGLEHTRGRGYDVVCLHGRKVVRAGRQKVCRGKAGHAGEELELTEALTQERKSGFRGRARDGLCAALAALGSRRQMCWLAPYDDEKPARGYFSHALADAAAVFRIALAPAVSPEAPRQPACMLLTKLADSMESAFESMDSGGPLKFMAKSQCAETVSKRQYTLQEIVVGQPLGTRGERVPAGELKADEALGKLMRSSQPVLVIDAYLALAPRDVARAEESDISEIVRLELASLLARAKAEGQAVVFQCGGENPHALAEKVYLRPPYTDQGLRCGYMRWRPRPDAPWGREVGWIDRALVGLQLP